MINETCENPCRYYLTMPVGAVPFFPVALPIELSNDLDISGIARCNLSQVEIDGVVFDLNLAAGWTADDLVAAVNAIEPGLLSANGDIITVSNGASTFEFVCATVSFLEDFGQVFGAIPQPVAPLPSGTTTYTFDASGNIGGQDLYHVGRVSDNRVSDPFNSVSMGLGAAAVDATGDPNGRVASFNGSDTPGTFYENTATGLVIGAEYEMRIYYANLNPTGFFPQASWPNLTMEVLDGATVVGTTNVGQVEDDQEWHTSVVQFIATAATMNYRAINASTEFGGNDVAIDQITFSQITRQLEVLNEAGDQRLYPNQAFFDDRHSISLSTPDYRGELDWFIVVDRENFFLPNFSGSDEVLIERGIYDYGSDPVLLKPGERQISMDVRFVADTPRDIECRRQILAYLLSWEHATSTDVLDDLALPSAFIEPNPFTMTYECFDCNSDLTRRHIDFVISWFSRDPINSDSVNGLRSTWYLRATDSRWYGEQHSIQIAGDTEPAADSAFPPPSNLTNIPDDIDWNVGEFRYYGTARASFEMLFNIYLGNIGDTYLLKSIVLIDNTFNNVANNLGNAARFRRVRHIDYDDPNGGWTVNSNTRIFFNSDGMVLQTQDIQGAVLADLSPEIDPVFSGDQSAFNLIPGRTYQVAIELIDPANPGVAQLPFFNDDPDDPSVLTFTPRYGGI